MLHRDELLAKPNVIGANYSPIVIIKKKPALAAI